MSNQHTASQWFQTGDKPTESQFNQLFNYLRWKDEPLAIADIAGLSTMLGNKQDVGQQGNIAWGNISGRPTALSFFTNDLNLSLLAFTQLDGDENYYLNGLGEWRQVQWQHLGNIPNNLATQDWVDGNYYNKAQANSRYYSSGNPAGYITNASLSGYATTAWADGRFQPLENQRLSTGSTVRFADVYADRGNGTGVIWFGGSSRYLFWDGANYVVNTNGEKVLFHQGNRRDNAQDDARFVQKWETWKGTLILQDATTPNATNQGRLQLGESINRTITGGSDYTGLQIRNGNRWIDLDDAGNFLYYDSVANRTIWHSGNLRSDTQNDARYYLANNPAGYITNAALIGYATTSYLLENFYTSTDTESRYQRKENQRLSTGNIVGFAKAFIGGNSTFYGGEIFKITGANNGGLEISEVNAHPFIANGIVLEAVNRSNNTVNNSLSLYAGGKLDLYSQSVGTPALSLQGGVGQFGAFTRFITNYASTLSAASFEYAPIQIRHSPADFSAGARVGLGFHQQGMYGGYFYMNGANEWRYKNHAGDDNEFYHTGNLRSNAQNDNRYVDFATNQNIIGHKYFNIIGANNLLVDEIGAFGNSYITFTTATVTNGNADISGDLSANAVKTTAFGIGGTPAWKFGVVDSIGCGGNRLQSFLTQVPPNATNAQIIQAINYIIYVLGQTPIISSEKAFVEIDGVVKLLALVEDGWC